MEQQTNEQENFQTQMENSADNEPDYLKDEPELLTEEEKHFF